MPAAEKAQPAPQQPLPAPPEAVAEPPPPLAEAPQLPKKKILPGRSAIGSLLKEVNDQIRVRPEETQKAELTAETLPELWKAFLDEFRHKAPNSFMTVAESQEPELREETIIFSVPNHISQEMLQLHKNEIATFFITRTTARVQLEFRQNRKAEPGRVIRSPKERLREMAAHNDAVNKLIQKFDLNLD